MWLGWTWLGLLGRSAVRAVAAPRCRQRVLDGGRAALTGADADGFLDRADEDLAVADATGVGRLLNGLHRALDQLVLQDDLDFYLGQEIDDVFGAAVELGVALLAAEALGLGQRDALDADLVQRFLHLVQLERLDDRFDLFHRVGGPVLCDVRSVGEG